MTSRIEGVSPPQKGIYVEKERWHGKIRSVALSCFESLRSILTFPLRYLGSKSWSIPGVIFRTPWLLFKRIFCKSNLSFKEELLGNKYHYSLEKELGRAELSPHLPYVAPIRYAHTQNPKDLLPGWSPVSPGDLDLGNNAPAAINGYFLDSVSGFRAMLLEKGDELVVCFGALELPPDFDCKAPKWTKITKTARAFFSDHHPHVKNIVYTFAGLMPPHLEKADAFVEKLRNHPRFKNKTTTLSGLCYGGAIASYIGIKRGIPTFSFNSFPLGVGAQYSLGKDRLNQADEYVTHISIKGDFLTDRPYQNRLDILTNRLGLRTPGHFGRRFSVPSAYKTTDDIHVNVLGSVLEHLGIGMKTPASNIK